jgi:enoyl-CoA hydratase/carnithine racemase
VEKQLEPHPYEAIAYTVDERIATITLDRPEALNAMSVQLCLELQHAVTAADCDPSVRVIVLTGAGDKAFSTGYDLTGEDMPDDLAALNERMDFDLEFTYAVWRCSKPTIAVIDGYCLGGALELAQMCDIRYASDVSRFGVTETRFSVGVSTMIMPWIVGPLSREIIYTGDMFDAERALQIGLVNRVFPQPELEVETMKIARRMSQISLRALQWNKRAINTTFEVMGLHAALRYGGEAATMLNASRTPEFEAFNKIRMQEGVTAAIRWRQSQFKPFE